MKLLQIIFMLGALAMGIVWGIEAVERTIPQIKSEMGLISYHPIMKLFD